LDAAAHDHDSKKVADFVDEQLVLAVKYLQGALAKSAG
jgi:hypothetical protein